MLVLATIRYDDKIERLRILQDREIKKYPDTKETRVSSDEDIQRLRDLQNQEINKYQIEPTTEDTDSSEEPTTTEMPPAPTTLVPETTTLVAASTVKNDFQFSGLQKLFMILIGIGIAFPSTLALTTVKRRKRGKTKDFSN